MSFDCKCGLTISPANKHNIELHKNSKNHKERMELLDGGYSFEEIAEKKK